MPRRSASRRVYGLPFWAMHRLGWLATIMSASAAWLEPARAELRHPQMIAWVTAETGPFFGSGAKFAFGRPVDTPGPMMMVTGGTNGAALLVGTQGRVLDTHYFIAAGSEYRFGRGIGARLHAEFYARPFPKLAASLALTCGTAVRECWSRARLGFGLPGSWHLGPEAVIATDRTSVGLALTGLRLGRLEMELSGGAERPWRGRVRPYGAAAVITRY